MIPNKIELNLNDNAKTQKELSDALDGIYGISKVPTVFSIPNLYISKFLTQKTEFIDGHTLQKSKIQLIEFSHPAGYKITITPE